MRSAATPVDVAAIAGYAALPSLLPVEALVRRWGGTASDFAAIAQIFDEMAVLHRRALERASDDPLIMMRACHELGSSFQLLGAERGERLARAAEEALREGEDWSLAVIAATLAAEIDIVQALVHLRHPAPPGRTARSGAP